MVQILRSYKIDILQILSLARLTMFTTVNEILRTDLDGARASEMVTLTLYTSPCPSQEAMGFNASNMVTRFNIPCGCGTIKADLNYSRG